MKTLHNPKMREISPTTPLTKAERQEAKLSLFWSLLPTVALLMLLPPSIQNGWWYFVAMILATLVVAYGWMCWYNCISKNSRGMTARLYREWRARRESNQQAPS